jgi:hypothetical protein
MRLEITDTRTLTDASPDVRELQFRNLPVTLGSGSNNLVQLPDINIAPHCANLHPMGEYWVYEPTLKDSGATLNGEVIADRAELHDGDVVGIHRFSLRVMLDEELSVEPTDVVQTADLIRIKQFPLPPRSVVRKPDANVTVTAVRQRCLASIAMGLRECTSLAGLLEKMVAALLREYGARAVWVGVRNDLNGPLEFIEGLNDQATRFDEPPKLETFVYRCLSRSQLLIIPRTGEADTQSVLAMPIVSTRGAIGLIHVDSRKHTRVYDEADLDFLTLVCALATPLIEKFLSEGNLASPVGETRVAAGPDVVHAVRKKCHIETPPSWPTLQTALLARDGEASVGDAYDVMKLPNGLAAMLLAPVDAEPARTAAAIAGIRGGFRVAGLHADPPHVQLKAINWLLYDEADPCKVEIVVLVINPKTGAMEIATAGKMGVLVIDPDGQPKRVGPPASPPLGTIKNAEYASASLRLDEGHTLALFTRGCTKAQSESGDPIGEKRFLASLCNNVGEPAPTALDDLLADTAAYLQNGRTPDDVTIIVATR